LIRDAQTARRVARTAFVGVGLAYVVNVSVEFAARSVDSFGVSTFVFPAVGIFILSRDPRNRIGWTLMGVGVIAGAAAVLESYARIGLQLRPGSLPSPAAAVALTQGLWAPFIGVVGIHLLLLFPNGRLPSRRWRKVAWIGAVAILVTYLFFTLAPGAIVDETFPKVRNPIGVEALRPFTPVVFGFIALIPISIVASAVSVVQRFRRSEGTQRLQLKWLTAAAATVAAIYALGLIFTAILPRDATGGDSPLQRIIQEIAVYSFILIPIAIGFAVLKYRLYDIDIVINKTVVYGALAAFITIVYVGIVVGIGAVIGQGDRPNLGLSILATATIAVAFQPVRERIQRFANRLVYGKRATPYEVLSHFAERMASTYAADELLPQMARILGEGTGAATADVWLMVGGELRPAGSWPDAQIGSAPALQLANDVVPGIPDGDLSVEVRDRGELLGALAIIKQRGEPPTEGDRKLLSDLASQAGLVLRNVKLIEELRASRQRIVSAQDEERRRIERNIHDGAQQQLVALNVKLGLAKTLLRTDAQKTQEMIEQLQMETVDALENLRDLARGIYPPLLADKGLVAALEAQARKSLLPVELHADRIGRLERDAEAAVYFCVLEALQNTAKYANASRATVRLSTTDGRLTFEVEDDGVGFDTGTTRPGSGLTNMADRIEALGGSLAITSEPMRGTKVSGTISVDPVQAAVAEPQLVG
jgi:signal transduction histidine kinase